MINPIAKLFIGKNGPCILCERVSRCPHYAFSGKGFPELNIRIASREPSKLFSPAQCEYFLNNWEKAYNISYSLDFLNLITNKNGRN